MCGFCGEYLVGRSAARVDEAVLRRMRDTMVHRGPDNCSLWRSPDRRVGLAHRRLSIVDLSERGVQPMSNEDGSVWLVYNGEVYNHLELRAELEAAGHRYQSRTDSESIIHAYEEWGIDAVRRLDGMFAFALWDGPRRQIHFARDRIGVKPFYYAQVDGRIVFASEIKALLAHPKVSPRLDAEALYDYLTFLVAPAPRTLFEGIHKLPPGHVLTIDGQGHRRSWKYWDVLEAAEAHRGECGDESEAVERIRALLRHSIRKRMMSDVPFGVLLSGGVDSSANVALMTELTDRPIETFSVGFRRGGPFDERTHAERVARRFGTNHHQVLIDDQQFLDLFEELPYLQDEPLADPVCVPIYYVAKLARENGITVVQVGEGSDEVFAGYRGYARAARLEARYWRHLLRLPAWVRRGARALAGPLVGVRTQEYLSRAARGEDLFWAGATAFGEEEKHRLLSPGLRRGLREELTSYRIAERAIRAHRTHCPQAPYLDRMIHLDIALRLPELLLMRVDKMTMANSVEARVPYLDHELVAYALALPAAWKLRNGTGKHIMKRAVSPLLPRDIVWRRKVGFCGSVWNMLTPALSEYARGLLLDRRLGMDQVLNLQYVRELLQDHMTGRRVSSDKVWTLLNFALWWRRWFT